MKTINLTSAVPAKRRTWNVSAAGITLLSVLLVLVIAISAYLALAPSVTRPIGPSHLEELALIKQDMMPATARFMGPSRLEELALIKQDMIPTTARFSGPSHLEELEYIKDTLVP